MDIVDSAPYFTLGLIICYIGQIFDRHLKKSERQNTTLTERDIYFKKLEAEFRNMEEEKSKIEADLMKNIEEIEKENEEIEELIDDDIDSKWSSDEEAELEDLKKNAEELKAVEEVIAEQSVSPDDTKMERLNEKINQLEDENRKLREQIDKHDGTSLARTKDSELDPELLNFLTTHEDISLDFLQKVYAIILEMKVSDPDKDFNTYVEELQNSRINYLTELSKLQIAKKEAEMHLEEAKRYYLQELSSFNEARIEFAPKNSVMKEYLDKLKESNRVREDIIRNLKSELDRLRSELDLWKTKYRDAEQQSVLYYKAYQDSLIKKERLEADRARVVSATSSFVDNHIPPPPPVKIPPLEEILRSQ